MLPPRFAAGALLGPCRLAALALLLAAVPLHAQRAPLGVLPPAGTRVRVQLVGERGWRVGRAAPAGPDTLRLLACPSCEPRAYDRARLARLEWSDGRGRNVGFYGALAGLALGAVGGAVAGFNIDAAHCPAGGEGEFCGLGGGAIGLLTGAAAGAVGGGTFALRRWGERWHPGAPPARVRR